MKNKKNYNEVGLLIQAVLAVFLLTFTIMTIFEQSFLALTEIVLSFMFFIMAYNNYTTYNRRFMTYVYIIAGILILGLSITLLVI